MKNGASLLTCWLCAVVGLANPALGTAEESVGAEPSGVSETKLVAPHGRAFDTFGFSVALAGHVLAVGVRDDQVGDVVGQGSVFVYRRDGTSWILDDKLVAPDGGVSDHFGTSVALDGEALVVGAPDAEIGDQVFGQGAVYVYVREGGAWRLQAKLAADDGADDDDFGVDVALDGETIVVGAQFDDAGSNVDQGSVYVFARAGTAWTQQAKLTAGNGGERDFFGVSVALHSDTAVVGAPRHTSEATGSAYVFRRYGEGWSEEQELLPHDPAVRDRFGSAVAIGRGVIIVGAREAYVGPRSNQGAAYAFSHGGDLWVEEAKLFAPDGATGDSFGEAVAFDGRRAVIGARGDDIGVEFDQGSAYSYTRDGGAWTLRAKLRAGGGKRHDAFGNAAAIGGGAIAIGAFNDTVGGDLAEGSVSVFSR